MREKTTAMQSKSYTEFDTVILSASKAVSSAWSC